MLPKELLHVSSIKDCSGENLPEGILVVLSVVNTGRAEVKLSVDWTREAILVFCSLQAVTESRLDAKWRDTCMEKAKKVKIHKKHKNHMVQNGFVASVLLNNITVFH